MKTHEFEFTEGEAFVCSTMDTSVKIAIREIDEANGVWLEIDLPEGVKVLIDGSPREAWGTPACTGLPRLWLMFSLVLSGRTKREVFMPSFNEFLEDYLYAEKMYQGRWEKLWTRVAFTSRSLWMVSTCFRIQVWGSVLLLGRFLWKKLFWE